MGRAIVREAEKIGLKLLNKPSDVTVLKGRGIEVNLNGKSLYIGNRKGLLQNEIPIELEVESYATIQEKKGNTAVFIADEKKILGVISIADTIRETAVETMQQLKSTGIEQLVMLTGDNKHTANIIGGQLGMDRIFAELLPEDKALIVNACMDKGRKLAMIGDGVNDAPALASADVGIAMGVAGTDIAMETADVVLMADNLDKLVHSLKLSKATVRNMKQNMVIAVGTVAILLAGVLTKNVNLASGMLIHELSVLLVILNAIRLVRYKPSSRFKSYVSKKEENTFENEACELNLI